MVKPYHDIDDIRFFSSDINELDLVWHRDRENRVVEVLSGDGWEFQYENDLPFILKAEEVFHIPRMQYHRIFKKGNTDLILRIHHCDGQKNGR